MQRVPGREGAAIATLLWSFDRSNLQHRLFSAGLDCQLTEWDLDALQPKAVTDSLGGAVWAMAARPAGPGGDGDDAALVAVACDDGAARLFAACTAQAGLQYRRSLPRVEGRLLSLAWSADGGRLYTGSSSGSIHIWSWPSGVEVSHITAGSGSSAGDGSGTCIWALAALADGTLASGDSEGRTCFWDGGNGEPLAQLQEHLADVTCVVAAPDASRVFSAGVDVRVALFARRPAAADAAGAPAPWVYSDCKRPHSHDVRALAVVPGSTAHGRQALLVSGGADAQLMVMQVGAFTEQPAARAGRCPQPPAVAMCRLVEPASDQLPRPGSRNLPHANGNATCSISGSVPLVLLASHRHLDLWLVPQPAESPDVNRAVPSASAAADSDVACSQHASNAHGSIRSGLTGAEGTPVPPSALPQHLARIRKKGDDHILSTALHPKATGIAFSDAQSTTVLAARWSPGHPSPGVQLSRLVPRVDRRLPPSHCVCFVPGPGLRLACVQAGGVIRVYDVDADAVLLRYELTALADHHHRATRRSLVQRHARSAVKALASPTAGVLASDDGQWLAARSATQVQLFNLETGRSHGRLQAAPDNSRVTCMGFSPSSSHIASCTVSHCVMLYEVESCAPTTWVKDYGAAAAMHLQTMPCCTSSIAFRPMQDALEVVLASPAGFCHINFKLPISSKRLKRRRTAHKPTEKDLSHPAGTNCRVLIQDQPCLGAGWLSPHSLLLLEHPWSRVLAQLPPPLYRHRYGT